MLLAKYKNAFGDMASRLYTFRPDFYEDIFCPDCEILAVIDFKLSGKTYQERKASLEALAISFSNQSWEGLCWSDLADITDYFSMKAKRYGLTEEFKENGII